MGEQQQPSWARSQIDDFIQRTVGMEDIRTPEDAVRYACSAAHVIAWDLHARIQELERELAETVAERDDLRTWSDEAATVLTRGLELMPLDQLRQWQGAAAIQQAYYDVVRREEGQLMTTASAIDATQVMRGMIAVSPVRVAQQPAAPDAGE